MGIFRSTVSVLATALAVALGGACGRTELWPALAPISVGNDGGVDVPAGDAGGGDTPSGGHADARAALDPCTVAHNPCGAGQRCVPALFRQVPGVPGGPDLVLALGDLNRDGLTDLVTLSPSLNSVAVWLNDATTGFHSHGNYTLSGQPIAAAIGEFTGDGLADIAVATFSAGEVTTLVGAGDGTFRMGAYSAVGAQPRALAAVDFTSDGHADLAIANQDPTRTDDVTLLTATGGGLFVPGGSYGSRPSLSAIAVGDFNNDGLPDIAAASAADSSVTVIYNHDFTEPVVYPVPTGARSIATGDFDGDGVSDMAVAGDNRIAMFFGVGNMPLRTGPVLTPELDANGVASTVVAGDFDDDGHTDLAYADGKQLYIFLGRGDGQFQPARAMLIRGDLTQPNQLAAGDLDGDGVTDLLVGSVSGEIVRFLSTASAVLSPAPAVPITGAATSSAAGDFDGDGNVDIAVGEVSGGRNVLVLYGNGGGGFPRTRAYAFGTAPQTSPIAAADLNNDGRSDIVAYDDVQHMIGVRLGRTDGTLGDLRQFPVDGQVKAIAALDANEDGRLDLVVARIDPSNTSALLLGNGDGTFQPLLALSNAGGYAVAVTDLDGDGHADIAVANTLMVTTFFGDGRTHFSPYILLDALLPVGVVVGDIDGDGRPDFVASESKPVGLQSIIVHRDRALTGSGFTATGDASDSPLCLAAGDINGDGRLDVAYASTGSAVMGLALGTGDGNFRLRRRFSGPGTSCTGMIVTDLNNDGRLDVVEVTSYAQLQGPWQLGIWLGNAPFECR